MTFTAAISFTNKVKNKKLSNRPHYDTLNLQLIEMVLLDSKFSSNNWAGLAEVMRLENGVSSFLPKLIVIVHLVNLRVTQVEHA